MMKIIDKIDSFLTFRRITVFSLISLILLSVFSVGPTASANPTTFEIDYEKPIIVSMGDSFSAGEGIEKFYEQTLSDKEKVKKYDWLAHRSEGSWPGMLRFPGLDGIAKQHKDKNWHFVAASGAETKHYKYEQEKKYSIGAFSETRGTEFLPPQLDVFLRFQPNTVDYVTMTIGGNDAGFVDIVSEAIIQSMYFSTSKLPDMLEKTWKDFYKKDGIRDNLYNAYKNVEKAAGAQAQIIVAGYPKLLDPDGAGIPITKEEAAEINRAVSNFNIELERLIEQCRSENMKICFVPVEEAFEGHALFARNSYFNSVYIGSLPEDLENSLLKPSAYSVHPNHDGAIQYADCVNKKIEQLEKEKQDRIEQEALNPDEKEREIVLVLDRSGSMSGKPMQETASAAREFVSSALEAEANVGIVAYDSTASVLSAMTDSEEYLNARIDELREMGSTNIEDGLHLADEMLKNSSAKKKIIVLMSDGEPNVGKLGQDLIDYADELKKKDYYIYTLGFFSNLNYKTGAYDLMEKIANEGAHFEVDNAESLKFFFGDIAEQIAGTKYYYIRIACPVDVTVEYNGEKMTSKDSLTSVRTSFGTMTFEENSDEKNEYNNTDHDPSENDDRVKILRLKEGVDYDIQIEGNGKGRMDYSIGFMDSQGEYSDVRKFSNVKISKKTKIDTVAANLDKTYMYVDEDGDGKYDITYMATADSKAKIIDYTYLIYIAIAAVALILLAVLVMLAVRNVKISRYLPR